MNGQNHWTITSVYPDRIYTVQETEKELSLQVSETRYTVLIGRRKFENLKPDHFYRLQVEASWEGLDYRLLAAWYEASGSSQDECYAKDYVPENGRILAPPGCTALEVEVLFTGTNGRCSIQTPILCCEEAYEPRLVRVCSISHDRSGVPRERSYEDNVSWTERQLDEVGQEHPDLVVLVENVFQTCAVAPPGGAVPLTKIPSPEVTMLCEKAKQYQMNLVCSVKEEDEAKIIHNTGLYINRRGEIAGVYRKSHLTISELEAGMPLCDEVPVFRTDFGILGIQICWDHFFPEATRLLALQGAEILAIPTHGYLACRAMTRAVDNGVYVATACTSHEGTAIFAPDGEELDVAKDRDYAMAVIDLNRPCYVPYLSCGARGEPNDYYLRERRPELYRPLCASNRKTSEKEGSR